MLKTTYYHSGIVKFFYFLLLHLLHAFCFSPHHMILNANKRPYMSCAEGKLSRVFVCLSRHVTFVVEFLLLGLTDDGNFMLHWKCKGDNYGIVLM